MGLLCLKNTSWFICLYPYYWTKTNC
jgi:hypothetical protein